MSKDTVLKGVIGIQAVCMIVLAVFVAMQQLPGKQEPVVRAGAEPSQDGSAAVVGDQAIGNAEWIAQLKRQYGDSVLRMLMLRSALDQESVKNHLEVSAEDIQAELDSQMEGYENESSFYREMQEQLGMSKDDVYGDIMYRLLLEKWMTIGIEVPDSKVDAYLEEHADELKPSTEIHLRWIVASDKSSAASILQQLKDGADFAELAGKSSQDEATAASGGDLGLVDEQDPFLDPAAAEAAAGLAPGELSQPIQVEQGYAIIELLERISDPAPDPEEQREQVRRLIALDQAGSLKSGEDRLLQQYGAATLPRPSSSPSSG